MLSDERQILNLSHRYAELNDLGEWREIGRLLGKLQCFAEGVASDAVFVGAEDVAGFYAGAVRMHEGSPRTRHVVTNLILEFGEDGASATTRSYFQVIQQTPRLPLQIIASGRYRDLFVKEQGRWRYLEKTIYTDFFGNLNSHAAALPAPE